MQKVNIISVLLVILCSLLVVAGDNSNNHQQSPYQIIVSYPKQVYLGQTFNISFELVTSIINSTNFQYITPGTRVVDVNGQKAYEGFAGYWMIDKIVNASSTSEIIVEFVGKIIGQATYFPGIVVYSSNFSLINRDGQNWTYELLVAWTGSIWLDKLHGWFQAISSLPEFYAGNYTVVLKQFNSSICIYSISINSSTYLIKYNTGIPWNTIGYIGIRLDTDTVLPEIFLVKSNSSIFIPPIQPKYLVYINGKEYSSGFSAEGKIILKAFSPTIINITFPQFQLYKIVYVSPYNGEIKVYVPVLQISLVVTTAVLIGVSVWLQIKNKRQASFG